MDPLEQAFKDAVKKDPLVRTTEKTDRLPWWLGTVNFIFVQWFFVRLAVIVEDDDAILGWCWLKGVVPLTGWWGNYWYLRKAWKT